MERKFLPNQEKVHIIESAVSVTSFSDLSFWDNPEAVLRGIGVQVSAQIDQYNLAHPGEMLPQNSEAVSAQFLSGKSYVVLTRDPDPLVLFHGTLYENFTKAEQDFLGFQVTEFGSVITNEEFRGMGLGSRCSRLAIDHVKARNHNTICLSTIKQELTARVLSQSGMTPVSFWELPYLSYLTCTCTNCSESHGFSRCQFRRPPILSTPINFDSMLNRDHPPQKTDCTLFVSDPQLAINFESHCRALDLKFTGTSLIPGQISVDSMARAAKLFAKVKTYV